jgi:glucose/arabinose dehydrogenase
MRLTAAAIASLLIAVGAPALAQNSGPESTPLSMKGGTAPAASPFTVTTVAKFDTPWAFAFLPDGRIIVTEKAGAIRIATQDGKVSAPLSGVPAVAFQGQGGLLDIKLSPGFARDGLVYITYAEPGDGGSSLALARGRLVGNALQGVKVLWRQMPKGAGGQFGAIVTFAPDGKSLFLVSGERQRFTPAQDPNQALGKILHLTLDGKPFPGNPGAGKTGASSVPLFAPPKNSGEAQNTTGQMVALKGPNLAPAETFSSGHRNPYGLAFAPDGKLWAVEMGPKGGDELNLIEAGKNYGWPVVSNGDNYDDTPIPDHPTRPEFAAPRLWWNPVISPSSLMFYTGAKFPAWRGSAFIGGLSSKALIRVTVDAAGRAKEAERFDMGTRIRDVVQAPDGSIWVLEDGGRGSNGQLMKLTPKQ